jgi:hypothetical protein
MRNASYFSEFLIMSKLPNWKTLSVVCVAALAGVLSLDLVMAQQKPAAKGAAKEAAAPAKPKGRLPAYYKDVVDEKQKASIYKLQADYAAKIEPLQEQIRTLIEERDAAIENVLSAEQKEKLKKVREEALAKRKAQGLGPAEQKDAPAATEKSE